MKVILITDVEKKGKAGDLIEAKRGYARNYLLPQGLAVLATSSAVARAKHKNISIEKQKSKILEESTKLANQLEGKEITIFAKCGASGRLFGSVTSFEVATAIKDQLSIDIDKKKIILSEIIKLVGSYTIKIKIHHEISAEIKLEVKGEA